MERILDTEEIINREVKCPNCNCDLEVMDGVLRVKDKLVLLIDDKEWYAMNTINRDKYIVLGHIDQTQQHQVIEK